MTRVGARSIARPRVALFQLCKKRKRLGDVLDLNVKDVKLGARRRTSTAPPIPAATTHPLAGLYATVPYQSSITFPSEGASEPKKEAFRQRCLVVVVSPGRLG